MIEDFTFLATAYHASFIQLMTLTALFAVYLLLRGT